MESETQQIQQETSIELEDYERSYFDILQEYQDVAQNKRNVRADGYVNAAYANYLSFTNYCSVQNNLYLSLININGDDVPELFIALKETNESNEEIYRIIDIYTYVNDHAKRIFNDNQLGYRNHYYVCSNDMIRCMMKDTDHPLSHVPLEAVYYTLGESGNIEEAEKMYSDNPDFEKFVQKYILYDVRKWNDLSLWENP